MIYTTSKHRFSHNPNYNFRRAHVARKDIDCSTLADRAYLKVTFYLYTLKSHAMIKIR
jgi:hypothetical protein